MLRYFLFALKFNYDFFFEYMFVRNNCQIIFMIVKLDLHVVKSVDKLSPSEKFVAVVKSLYSLLESISKYHSVEEINVPLLK